MSTFNSKYSIEIVNSSGVLLADLTGRALSRNIIKSRNQADEITWSVELNEFEAYCRRTNQDPLAVLVPCSSEVRVKRLGTYLVGGQLVYFKIRINETSQTIDIKATGFLNLFKDRYTAASRLFSATEATTIASTLINETQALASGNFGVTIGPMATAGIHDRSYKRTNIKTALQDLTNVQTNPFDFEFTYNKVFKTYVQIGTKRNDIIFEYPNNIKSVDIPTDGTGIANEIIALGSGFGIESQATATADSAGSQLIYNLRQKIIVSSGTDNSDNGLTDAANTQLAAWAYPSEIPTITVNGNVAPYVTDYGIGDRVIVRFNNYAMLKHINAYYRIEKIELVIDEEDNETVKLYLSA